MSNYDDIIDLPHHVSRNRPRMTMYQRAAQFAPFAALTGHGAAISETARLTDSRIELLDHEQAVLDSRLAALLAHLAETPAVELTYFIPDTRKEGGRYATKEGHIQKWDAFSQTMTFDDGTAVQLQDIIDIQHDLPPHS